MVGLLIFILLMSSWSFFFAAYYDKDYRETLPISVVIWVVFLLIFGVAFGGKLNIGIYVELAISFVLYVISIYKVTKEKKLIKLINKIVSLSTILFGVYVVLCFYCLKGIMFTGWDEFSHWGDVVKAMTIINDFSTSPISESLFKSYPPGMVIIQYICEELVMAFGYEFQEWVCYFCYDACILLFALPFFKDYNNKKFIFCLVMMEIIITIGLPFFNNNSLTSIYIDPIMSFISGYCLASAICAKTRWDYYYTFSLLSLLVILKDSGMLFTIFGAITLILKYELSEEKVFVRVKFYIGLALSICVTKLTWLFSIKTRNVVANFSSKYDIAELFKIISGQDNSYKSEVLLKYFNRFLQKDINLINLDINISNLFVLAGGVIVVTAILSRLNYEAIISKKEMISFIATIVLLAIIYVLGMGFTYVFKFGEYEASNLASFNRYINTLYCCIFVISIALTTRYLDSNYKAINMCILLLIIICPREYYEDLFKRKYANKITINAREEYFEIVDKIKSLPSDAKIYVISQENDGFDELVIRYSSRPITTNGGSVGISFYDGDIWTVNYSLDEFKELLLKDYDYLVLYKMNDYFVDTYGSLFEDKIKENCIYSIDKSTGTLCLVK